MIIYDNNEFEVIQRVAKAMVTSGYFADTHDVAQGIVKIMAGKELGLPAFASMSGIHIIKGKPTLGSNVMATLVKNDPRYDYRVKQADNKACVLTWYEHGEVVGESSFTMAEAQKISTKENNKPIKLNEKAVWRFYPSDMLFARAISRGARRYAPGIFGGAPVYTPDEMGMDTDENGYIEVQSVIVEPEPIESESIEQVIEDAGPEDIMTIEKACAMTNSKGKTYGSFTADDLSNYSRGIGIALNKNIIDADRKAELEMKLKAIKVLLTANADGEFNLPAS